MSYEFSPLPTTPTAVQAAQGRLGHFSVCTGPNVIVGSGSGVRRAFHGTSSSLCVEFALLFCRAGNALVQPHETFRLQHANGALVRRFSSKENIKNLWLHRKLLETSGYNEFEFVSGSCAAIVAGSLFCFGGFDRTFGRIDPVVF